MPEMPDENLHALGREKPRVVKQLAQQSIGILRQTQIDIAVDGGLGGIGPDHSLVEGRQREQLARGKALLERHEIEHRGAEGLWRRKDRVIDLARYFAMGIAAVEVFGEFGQKGAEALLRLQPRRYRHVGDQASDRVLKLG